LAASKQIIHVIRHGQQRRDAPHKTLYNRFVHWSRMGVFDGIFAVLASSCACNMLAY
jgi:hypothetical protein